ncbi:hypothetical protein SOCE26_071320 [Sorangium cellulosum]|uniref:Lipoprotein n=1 Tax=Sorangium cellulosum TaxID=56 RepID=A0A2L0F267_SORCE|nr:hypothetical protein [Sorangium cellulosum]AUX45637.1 hypothetical protein SOCE26_071320 [Sorangium cellulosum]
MRNIERMCAAAMSLAAAALAGCSGGDTSGTGSVAFSTWGEAYIEEQIPASDLEDGWSIRYEKFLLVLRNVTVADRDGNVGATMQGSILVDHTKPGPKPVVTFDDLEAKPWEQVSYEIGPPDADTALDGATEEDRALLLGAGASVHIEATARKADVEKRIDWTFTIATRYAGCAGDKDGKALDGVLVTNGGTDLVELTIHGDHFFYDDLQAAAAKRRFGPIAAADADDDGAVTLEELAAVRLVAIEEGPYGTGSAGDVDDLGAFVAQLSRTIGHFRGEGECVSGDP